MEQKNKLSVDVIISFSFTINSNCQNDHCNIHDLLRDACKEVDDQENDLDKIAAFKQFCKDNIAMFSIIENFLSKQKIEQVLGIKTIYNNGS